MTKPAADPTPTHDPEPVGPLAEQFLTDLRERQAEAMARLRRTLPQPAKGDAR